MRSDEKTGDKFTKEEDHETDLIDNNNNKRGSTADTIFGFPRDTVAGPLAFLLLSQLVLFIGVGAVIPSIPIYGKEIGLSSAANGVVISAPAVAMLLGAKFGGNYADRARKPAMILGMAIIAASDVGTAFASGLATLVVARLGLGAGRCISEAGERGMLADLAGQVPELRGRALAAQSAVIALGIAIGAPLGGMVIEQYGPRASFLCVSAAALFALVSFLFLPETRGWSQGVEDQVMATTTVVDTTGRTTSPANATTTEGVSGASQTPELVDWPELLARNSWRGLALCQCGASFGFAAKIASIPLLATATLPGGAAGAGALLSAAGLSGLVGAPIGGWLTDQTSAKATAALSGIVSGTGLMLIPVALSLSSSATLVDAVSSVAAALPIDTPFVADDGTMRAQALAFSTVVILWSIGASSQGPALTALAQELAPVGAEATAMALPRAAGDGTYIVAPFLLGLVTDSFVQMPGIECAAAGVTTLLGVLALLLFAGGNNDEKDDEMSESISAPSTTTEATLASKPKKVLEMKKWEKMMMD